MGTPRPAPFRSLPNRSSNLVHRSARIVSGPLPLGIIGPQKVGRAREGLVREGYAF
jgi:hypothetical protein